MFNNELRNSGISNLNETFKEIYDDFMMKIGEEAQNPAQIAEKFPIEIVSYDDIFEVLYEAVQKKAYAHIGCFFRYEETNVARDSRITRRKVYTDFRQIICFRGEVYELCDNGNWVERKILQDIRGKWHLWDGTYSIEVWIDGDKRSFTTNPPKPTKIFSVES